MEIRFPNGVVVRGMEVSDRTVNSGWRTFGLYLDARWNPTWPAETVSWPDFGTPQRPSEVAAAIRRAYQRALDGERVEVGCAGGLGRTGTVLACMAVLSGVPVEQAVTWVRANYDARAVETIQQEEWVAWFAANQSATSASDVQNGR